MRTSLLVAAALSSATAAVGQFTHTIPNGTATTPGNTSNAFPWGASANTWGGLRLMAVYDSVNFTAANPAITFPILISRLKWRAQDGTQSWTGGMFTTATVNMSTCPVNWSAVTTNYATNHGPDLTVVYQGSVTAMGGSGLGPGIIAPTVTDLVLTTPFLYDPNLGDLVIDVDYPGGTNFVGGSLTQMDVQSTNSNAVRIYASSQYPSANGITQNHGPVVEFEYLPAAGYGSFLTYGQGCGGGGPPGIYELFTTPSQTNDLANLGLSLVPTGSAYVALQGSLPFVPPAGTALSFTSNQTRQVSLPWTFPHQFGTTTSLWICSNGWISFEPTTLTDNTESIGELLTGTARLCAFWDDLDPSAGGAVHAEVDAGNPSTFHVTWTGVPETGNVGANTFQVSLTSGGSIEVKWGAMSAQDGLVGFHPGGSRGDPGATDISTMSVEILGDGTFPLSLRAQQGSRPVLGTVFNSVIGEIPTGSGLGAMILGLTKFDPGIDLTSLGMPGCFQHASPDATFVFFPTGTSATIPATLPNDPMFAGFHLFSQGAVFAPAANPLGIITSNGGDWTVDVN